MELGGSHSGSSPGDGYVRQTMIWAMLGVLCKEHAITVLALCAAWDVFNTTNIISW